MNESGPLHIWAMRAIFVGCALLILVISLMPLDPGSRRFAFPDILVALSFAWAVRRPEYIPATLAGLVLLLADFLLMRPPGLWAALVLVGLEVLKVQGRGLRDQTFAIEWLTVAIVIATVFVLYRLVAALFMIPQAPLGLSLMQAAGTVAIYPPVVLGSFLLFGLRKAAPGEVDTLGHRS